MSDADAHQLTADLKAKGVTGVEIGWLDNNALLRARVIPIDSLQSVAVKGVGMTPLSSVFGTYETISTSYNGQSYPRDMRAEVRLVPALESLIVLPQHPAIAFAPGYVKIFTGERWVHDPRSILEQQAAKLEAAGYSALIGYEMEFFVGEDNDIPTPYFTGPSYSANGLTRLDGFLETLLADFAQAGIGLGMFHGEFGKSQFELSMQPYGPVEAADQQLKARIVLGQAAKAHGLRVSYNPVIFEADMGNGWHVHSSLWKDGENLLSASEAPDAVHGINPIGAAYIAGLVKETPAISAIATPTPSSYLRKRPGYFAGAYSFWGIENREASVRYVPGGELVGADYANIEVKTSDGTGNPYLTVTAILAAGLYGVEQGLPLPAPTQADLATLSDEQQETLGIRRLPTTIPEGVEAIKASIPIVEAIGEDEIEVFTILREVEHEWAKDKTVEEQIAAQLWKY